MAYTQVRVLGWHWLASLASLNEGIGMPFFDYRQNNSGGGFDFDDDKGVSLTVIIEADSAEEANDKAQSIGLYFDGAGDCSTCGYRWSDAYGKGDDVPSDYGTPISDTDFGWYRNWAKPHPVAYVHFADGLVQAYGLPEKELN